MKLKTFILSGILLLSLFACQKENNDEKPPHADALTQRVTTFIYEVMNQAYLWNDQLPTINRELETDAEVYFKKLLVEEDRFSHITDDAASLFNSLEGIEMSFGYSLAFSWLDEHKTRVAAIIEYVYPNSPAAKAELKRGDIIVALNGQNITEESRLDLIYKSNISITYIRSVGGETLPAKDVALTASKIEVNPVHTSKILNVKDKKVGYLFYSSFIGYFNKDLLKVFTEFKNAGVSELILDLRYNLGGDENALVYLSSLIVPQAIARNKGILIKNEYNTLFTAYFKENGIDKTIYFTDTLTRVNLDLNQVFILTSRNSYSSSEATIVGLQPYMDVVCIGETTGGKYTGMNLFTPTIVSNGKPILDPMISNWALMPITSLFKNKNGVNPKGGISPQFNVNSFYLPMVELGDVKDPLIAKAVELLGGQLTQTLVSKSASLPLLVPFAHQSSRFDDIKKNLIKK